MIGAKYGKLTIICYVAKRAQKNNKLVLCLCECGRAKISPRCDVRSGHTKSCGCVHSATKHGLHRHKLYGIWTGMRSRCNRPKTIGYKNYGGRGISVCDEWENNYLSFHEWAIANGWKCGLQIDRINNDGNYTPENCRFVTKQQNLCNKGIAAKNTSGVAGVTKRKNRFESRVSRISLGYYKTKEDALAARNAYITENNLYYNIQRCA